VADAALSSAPRERGWRRLLPALALFLLVPGTPLLRVVTPVEETILLLTTSLAACALVGWWLGGRAWLAVVWCAVAGWALTRAVGGGHSGYDRLASGWALVLGAAFGFATLLDARRAFFARALTALCLAGIAAGAALALGGVPLSRVRESVRAEAAVRHAPFMAQWAELRASPVMRDLQSRDSEAGEELEAWSARYAALPALVARGFPALLLLESLAALGIAWSLYHRMSRTRIGPPLAPLKQFRFNDQLVWGLIVGLVIAAVPTLAWLRGLGVNLLVFFGALYALRGLGVLSWLFKPGWLTTVALAITIPLLFPLYAAGALAFGVGDTWIDWRRRPARPTT
jgi:hypothetical protein